MIIPPETIQRLSRVFFSESTPSTEWCKRLSALLHEQDRDVADLVGYLHVMDLHQRSLSPERSVVPAAVCAPLATLKHFDSKVTLLIQTTVSERWLAHVVDFYENIGVKPIFELDAGTSDGARAVLAAKKADCFDVGTELRVDSLSDAIFRRCGSDWILRISDDEFPTPALLNFVDSAVEYSTAFTWGFPRVHLRYDADRSELQYSEFLPFGPFAHSDLHWRLVSNAPGPKEQRSVTNAVLVSYDWIVRSFMERVDRLRRRDDKDGLGSISLAPFYLHETIPASWHMFSSLHDERYEDLARRIHRPDPMQT
jgi:hypothetical protein